MGFNLRLADDYRREGDETPVPARRPFSWVKDVLLPVLAGVAVAILFVLTLPFIPALFEGRL